MTSLNCRRLGQMASAALAAAEDRADEFSALDAVTGDGDHGTAIVSALAAVDRVAQEGTALKKTLHDMGFAAMCEACGSTSTLIGALFMGMGDGVETDELDAPATAAMFASGLANVQKQTKAALGDKTMIDALLPAVKAMQADTAHGVSAMLEAAAAAAADGAESTRPMVARFGRAKNLGDRVVGHLDAGAVSTACMFSAFSQAFTE